MRTRRTPSPKRQSGAGPAAIAERELAAVAPSLFSRPALWRDLALPPQARAQAAAAPWSGYWAVRLGPLRDAAADRAVLDAAWHAFDAGGDRLGALLCSAAAIETYYFDETELEPLDGWIVRLDAALAAADPPWPNAECAAEVMACGCAIRLRQPTHARLAEWAAQAPLLLTRLGHVPSRIKYAACVAHYHLWRGEFASSALVFDALPGVDLSMLRPAEALIWLEGLAGHSRFIADFERGRDAVRQALELVAAHGMDSELYGVHALGAGLSLAEHDTEGAARHVEGMREALARRPQLDQTGYWLMCAGLALLRGQYPAAVALARSTLAQSEAIGGPYRSVAHRASLACALSAVGDWAGCVEQAQAGLSAAQAIDASLSAFSLGLLASMAHERLGDRPAADRLLADAMALGAAHDYRTTNGWWLPELVADRMARALRADIEPAYARRFVQRRGLRCADATLESWPWPLVLRGFGEFCVWLRGEALTATGARVAQRPLDLLRAVLAHGGASVPVATVLEWLWPEADAEQQRKAFDVALLRLRRVLGDERLLLLDGGHLLLDAQRCWSDVGALSKGAWSPAPFAGDAAALVALGDRLLGLARAPLLDGLQAPWALAARERARRRFVLALVPIAQALEATAPREACRLYERALEADPLAESLAQRLIRSHLERGERADALRAWLHCKGMLGLHGLLPAAQTLALVRGAALVD